MTAVATVAWVADMTDERLAHFQARVIQDAFSEASRRYWCARADMFERARPHPGDFTGRADPWSLQAADERCATAALACRRHAEIAAASWLEAE